MERRVILVAIIEDDGKFLLTRQSSKGRDSGLWGFPGGNLEEDEDDLGAALGREVMEEVGLMVKEKVLLDVHVEVIPGIMQLLFLYYLVETRGRRVRPGAEIDEFKWLTLEKIKQLEKEDIRPPHGWFEKAVKLLG